MSRKLLFIVAKRAYEYGAYTHPWSINSGLYNSANFVVQMLAASGIEASIVQVADQNAIDAQVAAATPTDVIIEAFWVTPAKLQELSAKYPSIRWFVRGHSEIPFLAVEGNAFAWTQGYVQIPAVWIASNTQRSVDDLRGLVRSWNPHWPWATIAERVVALPNYYPLPDALARPPATFGVLNVACFGALRLLKNQVMTAVAAVELARQLDKRLNFHINGTRIEGQGSPNILKNLEAIFSGNPNATLVQHPWVDRDQFLALCAAMDLGLQVSFTETFNIVTADMVTENTPVVVSSEISWIDKKFQADPTSRDSIIRTSKTALTWYDKGVNRESLAHYDAQSRRAWLNIFGNTPGHGWHAQHGQFVAQPAIVEHRSTSISSPVRRQHREGKAT